MRKLSNAEKQKRINKVLDAIEYIIYDLWYLWLIGAFEIICVVVMLIIKGEKG